MSRRKANLEIEYALERENKELKEQIAKLKKQLRDKEKSATTNKEAKKLVPVKKPEKECPKCGAGIISTELPHGTMELCKVGCGHREVRKK